ncbi:polysaccharide deacetylase family protein [Dongia sp.]|uniref:polysaccharide deacetylase family protein n=1 Tax=Dongia sp. TaxID=1977262 RepID=UPI0035B4CD08
MPASTMTASQTAVKQIVVHEDDLGMCHGANTAFLDLSQRGVCTSGSVMVPCPWFLEIAALQAAHPALDIGVHLTLNAEKSFYRWRPLTRPSPAAGLADGDGYAWRTVGELRRHAVPDAVEAELRAQIDAALAVGIDVTHVDSHMGALLCPEFVETYVRVALDYALPVLLTRAYTDYDPRHNLGDLTNTAPLEKAAERAAAAGIALADRVLETPWVRQESTKAAYADLMARLEPGLNFPALHFNAPGEIEAIEPGSAHIRTEEFALFQDKGFTGPLFQDCELVGMRGFRDGLRGTRTKQAARQI